MHGFLLTLSNIFVIFAWRTVCQVCEPSSEDRPGSSSLNCVIFSANVFFFFLSSTQVFPIPTLYASRCLSLQQQQIFGGLCV